MSDITKGWGRYGRVYDRLRKRSQRRHSSYTRFLLDNDYLPTERSRWFQVQHEAYVLGVKDALQAAEEDTPLQQRF